MREFVPFIEIFLLIIYSVGVSFGFKLNQPLAWLVVSSGMLLGIMLVFFNSDLISAIAFGIFFSVCAIWGGPIVLRNRKRLKE